MIRVLMDVIGLPDFGREVAASHGPGRVKENVDCQGPNFPCCVGYPVRAWHGVSRAADGSGDVSLTYAPLGGIWRGADTGWVECLSQPGAEGGPVNRCIPEDLAPMTRLLSCYAIRLGGDFPRGCCVWFLWWGGKTHGTEGAGASRCQASKFGVDTFLDILCVVRLHVRSALVELFDFFKKRLTCQLNCVAPKIHHAGL